MATYISSIKNWFKAGYEGRHLELFLLEIARHRPEVMNGYLAKVLNIDAASFVGAEYRVEVPFRGQRSNRRADLAVIRHGAAEPFILIEIKYHDKPLPETAQRAPQLDDYALWKTDTRRGARHVLVLSRELYDADGIVVRRWDHLARALREPAKTSDLVKVLVDYLEEEGIVMQKVDSESLQRYFTRLVCHSRNVGRASDNLDGPVEFAKVLKNLQMLSGTFTPRFKASWAEAGEQIDGIGSRSKVATIDFRVRNRLKTDRPWLDDDGELPSEAKDGGVIDVFASHSLGHNDEWIRIDYGMHFTVPGSRDAGAHAVELYVRARGKQFEPIRHLQKVAYSVVTDKAETYVERVEGYLCTMLLATIDALLGEKKALAPKQRKALKLLQKDLAGNKAPDLADAT